jgi:MFS family permease
MSMTAYRRVLRLPGHPVAAFALWRGCRWWPGIVGPFRLPPGQYAAAGLVGTALTLGAAVGAPVLGRAVDTGGLRRALIPSVVAEAVVWSVAPFVGYRVLLFVSVVGGVLGLPLFTVVRQSLSVLVPPDGRRTAYALDSIGIELSFMAGPAIGVAVATGISTRVALIGVGVLTVASGVGLLVLNPPTRSPVASPDSLNAAGGRARASLRRVSASPLAVCGHGVMAAMVPAGRRCGRTARSRSPG